MNKIPFVVSNKKLTIDGHTIDIPHSIQEAFTHHDFIVFRVEPPVGIIFNRNVFGVGFDGETLWQIEETSHGTQEDKPYVNVYISEKTELITGNWNGVSYSVNCENGKITAVSFDK